MKTIKQQQKNEALRRISILGLSKDVMENFKKHGLLNYSDEFGNNHLVSTNSEIQKALSKLEVKYPEYLPYYIVKTTIPFIGCTVISFFSVSTNIEEWDYEKGGLLNNWAYVNAYNENLGEQLEFEIGSIDFELSEEGGLIRTT